MGYFDEYVSFAVICLENKTIDWSQEQDLKLKKNSEFDYTTEWSKPSPISSKSKFLYVKGFNDQDIRWTSIQILSKFE